MRSKVSCLRKQHDGRDQVDHMYYDATLGTVGRVLVDSIDRHFDQVSVESLCVRRYELLDGRQSADTLPILYGVSVDTRSSIVR